MKDTDLFSRIFVLAEPWFVEAVELNTVEGRVDICVGHGSGVRWRALHAGGSLLAGIIEPGVWRHLFPAHLGHVRQRGVNSGVFKVAIGQAALGGIWAGCASLGWGLSSAMASTCM